MSLQSAKKLCTMNLCMGFYSFAGVDVVSCITNFKHLPPTKFLFYKLFFSNFVFISLKCFDSDSLLCSVVSTMYTDE